MFKTWLKNNQKTLLLLALAILLRLFFSFKPAQPYDIGTFQAWGQNFLNLGPVKFYQKVWTDYLPLPIYFLAFIRHLASPTSLSFPLFFKFTLSLLDLVLIYFLVKNLKDSSARTYILLSLIFSPALLINSSLWGQLDALVTLTLTLSLLLIPKKFRISALLYGIAVALKPITLLALPAITYYLLQTQPKKLISFAIISFTPFFLTGIPPVISQIQNPFDLFLKPFLFLYNQALNQASTYPYTTINAFNFWSITGNNWLPDQASILGITPHLVGLLIFFFLSFLFFKKFIQKNSSHASLYRLSAGIFLLFFTFSTRMHERHLLYALPLILFASLKNNSDKLSYLVLTLLNSANMLAALSWVQNNQTWPISQNFRILLSLLTVFATISFTFQKFFHRLFTAIKTHKTLTLLLFLAFLLRLFNLSQPPKMIFDEVYHAFTAKKMLLSDPKAWEWWNNPPEGYAYEWTHPPLAKYGMVLGMLFFGQTSLGWRIGSVLMGVLSLYFLYQLTKTLLKNKRTALLAVAILAFEGLHLVQSQIAMNDIYLLTFTLATLVQAAKSHWKKAAILFGLALSSKWSAAYALPLLAFLYLQKNRLNLKNILQSFRYLLISAATYFLLYTPFFLTGHTYQQFFELHKQMWFYHTNLEASHSYQSQPWQWLLAFKPVWYYVKYLPQKTANIYAQLNPAIALLGLLAFFLQLKKAFKNLSYTFFYLAYLIFFLPWVFSPRIMFVYHYLPSITFLSVILSSWLNEQSQRLRYLAIFFIVFIFLLLSPMYYGYPVAKTYWRTLFSLFPTWK